MQADILIYQDYVHNNGMLHRSLTPFGRVAYCDAADILAGALDGDARLFVMPGGADLYYREKLDGAGNAAIRRYVENGGSYLGLCAGAYYACAALSWAAGTAQEISGPRELALYSGTATGPIGALMQGLDESWLGAARIETADGNIIHTFYEAGPYFSEPGENETVIARYTGIPGKPPAIVSGVAGRGTFILSGPHIERLMPDARSMLYTHRNPHHAHDKAIFDTMADADSAQKSLWDSVVMTMITRAGQSRDAA